MHIVSSEMRLSQLTIDLGGLLTEPGFIILNFLLSSIFSATFVLSLYVFFISFTCSYLVIRHSSNALMLMFGFLMIILIPNMWSLQLGAIRQGLAASIIFWAFYFCRYGSFKFFLIVFVSGLVHIGGLLVFAIFTADNLIKKIMPRITLLWRALFISTCLCIGWLSIVFIIPFLDSKHSGYVNKMVSVGGGLFLFYLFFIILLYFKNSCRKNLTDFEVFGFIGVTTYLGIYFLSPIAGRWLDFFVLPIILHLISRCSYRNLVLTCFLLIINGSLFFNGAALNIMNKTFW
jgi:hypothetical protein